MDGENELKFEELKKLKAALRALEKERVFVPGAVDARISKEVHEHFKREEAAASGEVGAMADVMGRQDSSLKHTLAFHARPGVEAEEKLIEASDVLFRSRRTEGRMWRRPRRWRNWMQKVLPLAASIAIAAMMIQFARMGRTVAGDVNADGNVDVVDALVLAERLRSEDRIGRRLARRWDVNGDQVVDARDSEEIMARVVDLERSGS